MKPNFALYFNDTGIAVLHRASSGWHTMGDVSLDDPKMDSALARLRSTATAIASSGLSTKLVIPNSQILYRTIPDPGNSDAQRTKAINAALIGATPYELDALVYDWHNSKDGLQLAVVARETLEEAEGFAKQHRFNPLSFVAIPDVGIFDAEPFFGRSKSADALIGKGTKIDPDTDVMHILPKFDASLATAPLLPTPDLAHASVEHELEQPQTEESQQDLVSAPTPGGLEDVTPEQPHSEAGEAPDTNQTLALENEADASNDDISAQAIEVTQAPVSDADDNIAVEDRDDNTPIETAETAEKNSPETDGLQAKKPSAGFQSMRASFGAHRSNVDTPTPTTNQITERLSAAPSRVLSSVTAQIPSNAPKLRVTAKSIPMETDQAPAKAAGTPEQSSTASDAEPIISGAKDLSSSGPQKAPKAKKSAPLPEPPAMPAPDAPQRRVDTVQSALSPIKHRLKRGTSVAKNVTARSQNQTDPSSLSVIAAKADTVKAPEKSRATATAKSAAHALGRTLSSGSNRATAALALHRTRKAEKAAHAKTTFDDTTTSNVDEPQDDEAYPTPLSADAAGLNHKSTATTKLSLFGAQKQRRKSRVPLGLILTALLIVFLGFLALWGTWTAPETTPPAQDTAQQSDQSAQPPQAELRNDTSPVTLTTDLTTQEQDDDEVDLAFEPSLPSNDTPIDLEQVTRNYNATGVWALAPENGMSSVEDSTLDLYIASIDPQILSQDPVALPNAVPHQIDALPRQTLLPAPAGTTYDLDARGLVKATPEGTVAPSGVIVFAGRPAGAPALRDGDRPADTSIETDPASDPVRLLLEGFSPRLRPDGLIERNEQANLGGLTRAQLGAFIPRQRPQSEQQIAQSDAEEDGADAPVATAPTVTASLIPKARPQNIAKLAAAANAAAAAAALAGPATTGETSNNAAAVRVTAAVPAPNIPKGPTATTVARAATVQNAINLRKVNLMGVYGSNSDRRALIRLPSGRLTKVKVGDRVDGGRVQSISSNSLTYTKGNRSINLAVGG